MSSSRRRRNKWLRTPQLGWVYYNPYYELYVLCVEFNSANDGFFMGKVLLSGNSERYKIGQTINCGTILSTASYNQCERYRNKKYKQSRQIIAGKWLGTAARNKLIIENEAINTFYKMYEL